MPNRQLVPRMSGEAAKALFDAERQSDEVRTVYEIPAHRLEEALERLTALAKKASRYSTTPVTVEYLGGPVVHERNVTTGFESGHWGEPTAIVRKMRIAFHYLRVRGEAPRVAGWTFVATLQHAGEAGTVIRAIPGEELPERFRTASPETCDHCHARRIRRDTYVLKHEDGVHYQQVGSSCLKDFLGGIDPTRVAHLCERLALLNEALGGFGGLTDRPGIDLATYLSFVAESIRRHGWVPRSQRDVSYPTADRALLHMMPPTETAKRELEWTAPSPEAVLEASQALDFVREKLDPATTGERTLSDFEHNLKVVTDADEVEKRGLGIAAYAIQYRRREMEREAQAAVVSESQHVGTVGQRLELSLTVISVNTRETAWGVSHIHKLSDSDGNLFVWFSSNLSLETGRTYSLKGTIKAHNEFRGVKETQLTRVTVQTAQAA